MGATVDEGPVVRPCPPLRSIGETGAERLRRLRHGCFVVADARCHAQVAQRVSLGPPGVRSAGERVDHAVVELRFREDADRAQSGYLRPQPADVAGAGTALGIDGDGPDSGQSELVLEMLPGVVEDNERLALSLQAPNPAGGSWPVGVVQIAGLVARRILCSAEAGDRLNAGQPYGLIRFGSRVDVWLPVTANLQVLVGQKAVAGETVLADLTGQHPALAAGDRK